MLAVVAEDNVIGIELTNMAFREVILNRGGCGYIIDNFVYVKDRVRNGKVYLRCIDRSTNCKGRAVITDGEVQISGSHEHPPPDVNEFPTKVKPDEEFSVDIPFTVGRSPMDGEVQTSVSHVPDVSKFSTKVKPDEKFSVDIPFTDVGRLPQIQENMSEEVQATVESKTDTVLQQKQDFGSDEVPVAVESQTKPSTDGPILQKQDFGSEAIPVAAESQTQLQHTNEPYDLTVKEVILNRGGCGYMIDAFVYVKDRIRNGKVYLRCIERSTNCKGRAVIVDGKVHSIRASHEHPPPDVNEFPTKVKPDEEFSVDIPFTAVGRLPQIQENMSEEVQEADVSTLLTREKADQTLHSSSFPLTVPMLPNKSEVIGEEIFEAVENYPEQQQHANVVGLTPQKHANVVGLTPQQHADVVGLTPQEVTLHRGGFGYKIGDFFYVKDRERNDKLYMRCVKRYTWNCKGRAVIVAGKVQSVTKHTHGEATDIELDMMQFKEKLRTESIRPEHSLLNARQVYDYVCEEYLDAAETDEERMNIFGRLPEYTSVQNILYRKRKRHSANSENYERTMFNIGKKLNDLN